MIEFFERHAPRFYDVRLILFAAAIAIFVVCIGTIERTEFGSVSSRIAWAALPFGFIPWSLALMADWFDPDRGAFRHESRWLSWLPCRMRSLLRGYAAFVLAAMLAMLPIFLVAAPLVALFSGGVSQ